MFLNLEDTESYSALITDAPSIAIPIRLVKVIFFSFKIDISLEYIPSQVKLSNDFIAINLSLIMPFS